MMSIAASESVTGKLPSVLFIDDEPKALDAFRRMLRPFSAEWNSYFLSDSRLTESEVREHQIDIVVTDLLMSFVSGIEVIQVLQKYPDTRFIPVIVVTGQNDRQLKRLALDAGATDLLTKPVELEDLLARIRSALRLKACYDELNTKNSELEARVRERTVQLQRSRLEIIARLSKAAEYRDRETGRHVIRVAHYSRLIAKHLGLSHDEADLIFAAAPLHDVGKIAVPDAILLKNGLLTDDERRIMQKHCAVGERILSDRLDMSLEGQWMSDFCIDPSTCDASDPILHCARQIAASHHEHWDGGGYPRGLSGEEIPIAGRIVALADVFDALTNARPYKPALSTAQSLRIISEKSGKQFDPTVHKAFLEAMPQIEMMRLQLQDESSASMVDLLTALTQGGYDKGRDCKISQIGVLQHPIAASADI